MTPEARNCPSPETFWRLGFLVTLAWIAALSLAPFGFSASMNDMLPRLKNALAIGNRDGIEFAVIHFLAFTLAGFCGWKAHPARTPTWRTLLWIIAGCSLLEATKLWNPDRHAMLLDLLVKITGSVVGVSLAVRSGKSAAPVWLRPLTPLFAATLALLTLAGWCHTGLKPLFGGLALDWNPTFRLLVGNEDDGSRPWQGNVHSLAVFDRALGPQEIHLLGTAGSTTPLLAYQFSGTSTEPVKPTGSLSQEPGMIMETITSEPADRCIHRATQTPAKALTQSIIRSGEFSVVADIATDNPAQTGPARIISLSKNPSFRNFTLGQQHDALEFRVANGVNGTNGSTFALSQRAMPGGPTQVTATYDHGYSAMFINGIQLTKTVDLREPWYYLAVNPGIPGQTAVLILLAICFLTPATLAIRSWLRGWKQSLLTLALLYLLACAPYAVCCLAGGPWNPDLFVRLLAVTLIVVPVSIRYLEAARESH